MRIVSVWLPRWPILRFLSAQARCPKCAPVDPGEPFVLSVEASGGPRITALNEASESIGLQKGELVADARAKAGVLQVHPADPAADDAALRRLTLWATRYTPTVSPFGEGSGADGLFLDVTGAIHLFGGEEDLLTDLSERLDHFGLPARLAIADTAGAAWALSHFHVAPLVSLPSGEEAQALASLPIEALRLAPETRTTLRRLGFKRVGALFDKPRAPFAARFERELLKRLDQAVGRAPEPLTPIVPPPVYHSLRYLMEPVVTQDAIVAVATRLMKDLVHALTRDGVGARALRLALYRIDGTVATLDLGLTLPTRDPDHVARLIALKLERMAEDVDAGLGFEALDLAVTVVETLEERQAELVTADRAGTAEQAALIDRLQQRLGARHVRRLKPMASHLPERAEAACAATSAAPAWPAPDETLRPLLLLPRAEPAQVTALVPEGTPRRFHWRGATYDIACMQGPERIADEWWRSACSGEVGTGSPTRTCATQKSTPLTRDYYLVEDMRGRRFWLYREGLYPRETAAPSWFVHGLFA